MRKIIFAKAGTFYDEERVFFQSRSRQKSAKYTIYHRNDNTTEWAIPIDIFKRNFKYERSSGIYRTELTYGALKEIPGVIVTIF